jgi:hypothetical protein
MAIIFLVAGMLIEKRKSKKNKKRKHLFKSTHTTRASCNSRVIPIHCGPGQLDKL